MPCRFAGDANAPAAAARRIEARERRIVRDDKKRNLLELVAILPWSVVFIVSSPPSPFRLPAD